MNIDYLEVQYWVSRAQFELQGSFLTNEQSDFFATFENKMTRKEGMVVFLDAGYEGRKVAVPVAGRMESLYTPDRDKVSAYRFSAWGADCGGLAILRHVLNPPEGIEFKITRIDLKRHYFEANFAPLQLASLLSRSKFKGARNLSTFDSKERSKAGGGSSGGKGFALGSHKSDMRLSVYKRNGNMVGVELQYSGGKAFEKVVNIVLTAATLAQHIGQSGGEIQEAENEMLHLLHENYVGDCQRVSGARPEELVNVNKLGLSILGDTFIA